MQLTFASNVGKSIISYVEELFQALEELFHVSILANTVWLSLCHGCRARADAAEHRNKRDAEELVKKYGNGTPSERLEAATTPAALAHYNDKWLTFTGLEYKGSADYPGRFKLSEQLEAGYTTTFALDGREMLVTPKQKRWMRLLALDSEGGAVFDNVLDESRTHESAIVSIEEPVRRNEVDFSRRGVPETYGEWTANVMIGSRARLREGFNNV
ncbi:hypothetical protein FGB62_60g110 [Gracilaria domingensis]|nr:hypothetical protein FGB62_60g110 [Gracilaria domingensis]